MMKFGMSLTRSEKIMALLNQWDPAGSYKSSQDYRVYSYEAETIAQSIRSNSTIKTIEKAIQEAFAEIEIDTDELKKVVQVIKSIR